MTDRIRLAAQALVDGGMPHDHAVACEPCAKDANLRENLRRALAEHAPCEHANTVRRRDGSKCLDCGEPLLGVFK